MVIRLPPSCPARFFFFSLFDSFFSPCPRCPFFPPGSPSPPFSSDRAHPSRFLDSIILLHPRSEKGESLFLCFSGAGFPFSSVTQYPRIPSFSTSQNERSPWPLPPPRVSFFGKQVFLPSSLRRSPDPGWVDPSSGANFLPRTFWNPCLSLSLRTPSPSGTALLMILHPRTPIPCRSCLHSFGESLHI